jgi:hypothetical protein
MPYVFGGTLRPCRHIFKPTVCWNLPTDQLHEAKRTHTQTTFIVKRAYRTL